MKKIIVAGNWKMNKTYLDAKEFVAKLNKKEPFFSDVILGVPSLYLDILFTNNIHKNVHIAAQNCSEHKSGAFTGEISSHMLASIGIEHCILGHSERRTLYGETDETINLKIKKCLLSKIHSIFCIGETLAERESNKTFDIIESQLSLGLKDISAADFSNIILAYEPVWAIGTGKTASKEQAQEVHLYIYHWLEKNYSKEIAEKTPILYGGSCNLDNAKELFSQPNIWGGLIGGASLDFDVFSEIIDVSSEINNS